MDHNPPAAIPDSQTSQAQTQVPFKIQLRRNRETGLTESATPQFNYAAKFKGQDTKYHVVASLNSKAHQKVLAPLTEAGELEGGAGGNGGASDYVEPPTEAQQNAAHWGSVRKGELFKVTVTPIDLEPLGRSSWLSRHLPFTITLRRNSETGLTESATPEFTYVAREWHQDVKYRVIQSLSSKAHRKALEPLWLGSGESENCWKGGKSKGQDELLARLMAIQVTPKEHLHRVAKCKGVHLSELGFPEPVHSNYPSQAHGNSEKANSQLKWSPPNNSGYIHSVNCREFVLDETEPLEGLVASDLIPVGPVCPACQSLDHRKSSTDASKTLLTMSERAKGKAMGSVRNLFLTHTQLVDKFEVQKAKCSANRFKEMNQLKKMERLSECQENSQKIVELIAKNSVPRANKSLTRLVEKGATTKKILKTVQRAVEVHQARQAKLSAQEGNRKKRKRKRSKKSSKPQESAEVNEQTSRAAGGSGHASTAAQESVPSVQNPPPTGYVNPLSINSPSALVMPFSPPSFTYAQMPHPVTPNP
eukprot:CAMPEP_0184300380 /NCGR_PEP_ID=MMETSP1049-20130417/10801_1 /TAXON_ID=77928 /ORGANISM="Proteomonas sulcata, Strain CCMP704" /LENGTH=532 /DNA_ID=CAMNT_0026611081 /DNA_START=184 /DNA_END=1782 /DNA_ORIENTATION=+